MLIFPVYTESNPRLFTPSLEGQPLTPATPRLIRFFAPDHPIRVQFHRKSLLYFQQLTHSFFDKSFPFIFIRIAPGGVGSSMSIANTKSLRSVPCPACPESRRDPRGVSPLKLTLTRKAQIHPDLRGACPNLQQITPLESIANLLGPLKSTLTKNAPVSPLELTLTKCRYFTSHRITLLQKRVGGKKGEAPTPKTTRHSPLPLLLGLSSRWTVRE